MYGSVLAGTESALIRETGAQCSKNTNQLNIKEGATEGFGGGEQQFKSTRYLDLFILFISNFPFSFICVFILKSYQSNM